MKLRLIYASILMYTLSAHSAELTKQEVSTIISAEGKNFLCKDTYNKLLAISGTLQNDHQEYGTANTVYFPDVQKPYCEIGHNTQYLQYIIDYISTDNPHVYLDTLSLAQLIHLYQNADYWNLNRDLLNNLQTYIAVKLQNKDVLNDIFSTQESLNTFLNACNSQTKATLAQALLPHVRNLFWSTVTQPDQTLKSHTLDVNSIAIHEDGSLFSSSSDHTVCVWKRDTEGTYYCAQTLTGHNDIVYSLAVHTDHILFSGSQDNTIRVWKKNEQGEYYCAQTLTGLNDIVYSLAVHPDGTLFSSSLNNTICIWKQDAQGQYYCAQTLTGHNDSAYSIAVHADGTLFSGSRDNTVRVWKPDTQGTYHCTQSLQGHTKEVNTVAVHADGTLFSAADDGTIRIWKQDAQDIYRCVQTLQGHTTEVSLVAVHTDGTLFCFGSKDRTMSMWKLNSQDTYECVQSLHTNYTHTFAVHIDGTLFSGLANGTILVWKAPIVPSLSLEQCIAIAYLYHQYKNNNKNLHTFPNHIQAIYDTFPNSVKDIIMPWYTSPTTSEPVKPSKIKPYVEISWPKK